MALPLDIINVLGPEWGVPFAVAWLMWELYCPLPNHTTKIQSFHDDLTTRLERIEITQVAFAEEIADVDEESVKRLHDRDQLSTTDLKEDSA